MTEFLQALDLTNKLAQIPWWITVKQMRMVEEIDQRVTVFAQAIGCPMDRYGNLVPQNDFQKTQLIDFVREMKRAYSDA